MNAIKLILQIFASDDDAINGTYFPRITAYFFAIVTTITEVGERMMMEMGCTFFCFGVFAHVF